MARPLLILVTGDPVPGVARSRGDFSALIQAHGPDLPWVSVDARAEGALPEPDGLAGIVVTGSSSSVTERAPWMLRAEAWLSAAHRREVPTLGICFGHQLLGQALGGEVRRNPQGREIGTVLARRVAPDALLEGAPEPFPVNMSHVDSVVCLPPGAVVLAATDREPHAAARFGRCCWGVQFHPEFDGDVVRGYLAARRGAIEQEGLPYDRLVAEARDAPAGAAVLGKFLALARGAAC